MAPRIPHHAPDRLSHTEETLHILYAIHGYKPAYRVGGPVVILSAIAERLIRRGHAVTVVTSNSNMDDDLDVPLGTPVDVNGVEVLYFGREEFLKRWLPFVPYVSKSMGFLYSSDIKPALMRLVPRADLVHTHMPYVYPTFAAAKAAFRFSKPLVYHQHGVFDPERLKFRGAKKKLYIAAVERPIMRRATTLIAETPAAVASYRALGVATPCRIVPNGVDVDLHAHQLSSEFNARWRIPTDAAVVLFMGRVHPIKGADRLLEAFLRIHAQVPNAILVIAGPDEWGVEAEFRTRVAAAGVEERVIFPGMLTGTTKLDFLARADLFCLPSDAEGFSMAVLEALASSTAVLLSPGCHFEEVATAGAGRIVRPDPDLLAAALVDVLSDPGRLRAMGRAGRALTAERYSWDRITDLYLDVYERAISISRDASQPSVAPEQAAVPRSVRGA